MDVGGENIDSAKKVNGIDAQTSGIVQLTYKKLQDADFNSKPKDPSSEMNKQNGTDPDIDDGAQEKMLADDAKTVITPAKNLEQAKFVSTNGETKVDIEIPDKSTLSGMGKEELMKFANDPFWIRLRWFLFVAFWLLWIGMLAGAITIIILAPKCVAPEPKKFWEKSVMVDLELEEIGNFDRFSELLATLKIKNIDTISLQSIFENGPDEVTNFTKLNPNYKFLENFTLFINEIKKNEQFIVLELNPHHTGLNHSWFEKSIAKEGKYTNYYIWQNKSGDSDNVPQPPENIISSSIQSESDYSRKQFDWKWNDKRQQFYVHDINKGQPILNYRDDELIKEMKSVLEYWIKLGVSGFRFNSIPYLIKDKLMKDNFTETNANLIAELHKYILNMTDNQGLLSFKEPLGNEIVKIYKERRAADLALTTQLKNVVSSSNFNSSNFKVSIEQLQGYDSEWPSWDLKRFQLKSKNMDEQNAQEIMLFTMLLPGTPVVRLNDIVNNTRFNDLSQVRRDPTFQHGNFSINLLHNDTVVAYTRIKQGAPGYLVAYYDGVNATYADFSDIANLPEEVETPLTPGAAKIKYQSKMIPLEPKSTLAMKFVTKEN